MNTSNQPDLILHHGRITTLDPNYPEATNLAIKDGRIVGVNDAEEYQPGPNTKVIDLKGRRVIPGLNDSHLHVIRGGLNYNLELRWDGVPSLADALRMLRDQALRTPPGQWVRVVGGWSEFQFAEHRMPTLEEINAAAPETPVFILHLYCRALLNKAALRACGYTKDTPNPPGGEIQRDQGGNPTGLLIARPNATAKPNIELALSNQRRDLSCGSSIACSFRAVPGGMVFLLPVAHQFAGLACLFGFSAFISLSSSGVICGKCRMNKTRRQVFSGVCASLKAGMPLKRTPF